MDAVQTIKSFSYSLNSDELSLAKDCPIPYENPTIFSQFGIIIRLRFHLIKSSIE